ncbi:MAG: metalloendopeptidase, partial [Planctomycetes bacterium]|nr:metalloendopeptidase [Planctomycetota bacterium]
MKTRDEAPRGGRVFDLAVGESAMAALRDGNRRRVTLLAVNEPRCRVRGVIRGPSVTVDVDGEPAEVPSAEYHLPQVVKGLKVACSVTRGVAEAVGRHQDVYALDKDARLRCWALDEPLFGPTPLVYPAKQAWFASMTQMANERCYVNACELAPTKPTDYIYHHYGLDIGGHDRAVPIVAARSGRVVVRGEEKAPDYNGEGGEVRYDRVVIRDDAGWWCFLYSHLDMIAPGIKLGGHVEAGDPVGVLGKEGSSGGWSHLHFGITGPQPSGRYGQVEGYPLLVEAYLHEHPGALLACARPHRVAAPGETVALDGSRSVCDGTRIRAFRWTLHDGETVDHVRAVRTYPNEGMFSEMLTVTDERGRTDVDFCVVQILPVD